MTLVPAHGCRSDIQFMRDDAEGLKAPYFRLYRLMHHTECTASIAIFRTELIYCKKKLVTFLEWRDSPRTVLTLLPNGWCDIFCGTVTKYICLYLMTSHNLRDLSPNFSVMLCPPSTHRAGGVYVHTRPTDVDLSTAAIMYASTAVLHTRSVPWQTVKSSSWKIRWWYISWSSRDSQSQCSTKTRRSKLCKTTTLSQTEAEGRQRKTL